MPIGRLQFGQTILSPCNSSSTYHFEMRALWQRSTSPWPILSYFQSLVLQVAQRMVNMLHSPFQRSINQQHFSSFSGCVRRRLIFFTRNRCIIIKNLQIVCVNALQRQRNVIFFRKLLPYRWLKCQPILLIRQPNITLATLPLLSSVRVFWVILKTALSDILYVRDSNCTEDNPRAVFLYL